MLVYEAVGETLRRLGVEVVFGLAGSGNVRFLTHLTNACGIRYYAARHESPAVSMADGYARVSGKLGVSSVTEGPGVTNAITALTEAVKGSTPLLLLAGDTAAGEEWSAQDIDQAAAAGAAGVAVQPIRGADTVIEDLALAASRALAEECPVIVSIPKHLQGLPCPTEALDTVSLHRPDRPAQPDEAAVRELADLVEAAHRPVIIAGRGARRSNARDQLIALADRIGALLATTGQAKTWFAGHPFQIGVVGQLGSDFAAHRVAEADLVLAFGASLNAWTTRSGSIFAETARIVHCDLNPARFGRVTPIHLGVVGDAAQTAASLLAELERREFESDGLRSPALADEIARYRMPGVSDGPIADDCVDPRPLFAELDRLLPRERTVALDSGRFMRYPAGYLSVPEPAAWVFAQDFQSMGLGLGTAVGAAVARPDRLTLSVIGDGGLLMSLGELETIHRYDLPILIFALNDHAYGPEVNMLEDWGMPTDLAIFDDVDFAAIARGVGMRACTLRSLGDLDQVRPWIDAPNGPMLVDCKLDPFMRPVARG